MPILATNSRARLSRDELHQLRWLLGLVLVLLAFWTLFGLEFGGFAWRTAFFAIAASALLWPAWPGRIPAWVRRWSLILGGAALFSEFFATRFDVLSGLVLMVSLLALFRGLQYRRLREDWQLILLCLFIIVLSGVLTLSLLFGLQILLFTVVTMGLLFVMNLLQRDAARELNAEDWRNFHWRRFLQHVARALDFRQLLQSAALFSGLVLVSTLIFVSMPRYQFEQSFSFPNMKGVAGFHGDIHYTEKWSVENDDSVAFRVDVPSGVKFSSTPYWRMIVLDEYRDNGFRLSNGLQTNEPNKHKDTTDFDRHMVRYPEIGTVDPRTRLANTPTIPGTWKFYLEGNVSEYLPVLGTFSSITFSSAQAFRVEEKAQIYRTETPSPKVLGYEIENMSSGDAMPAAPVDMQARLTLAEADGLTGASKRAYPFTCFGLPENASDRQYLDDIVKQIRGDQTDMSQAEFIRQAEVYLWKHHQSSMSMDLTAKSGTTVKEQDLLVRWLATDSPGWCEHFAGSFVLLARAAGYPARVVAGYKGAVYNSIENYYSVRQSYAHAWAEVYDGKDRWIRVDPSPGSDTLISSLGPGQTSAGITSESGWNAFLDSLRMIWYRRVINFDQTDQAELADKVQEYGKNMADTVSLWFFQQWKNVVQFFTDPLTPQALWTRGLMLAAVVLIWLRLTALRNLWLRLGGSKWLARVNRLAPVRLDAGRWLRRFEPAWVARAPILPEEERHAWKAVRQALLELRYGPLDHPADPAGTFRQAKKLLKKKIRTAKLA